MGGCCGKEDDNGLQVSFINFYDIKYCNYLCIFLVLVHLIWKFCFANFKFSCFFIYIYIYLNVVIIVGENIRYISNKPLAYNFLCTIS